MSTVVLITGANKGIGKATAVILSKRTGYKVYIGCRDLGRGEATASEIKVAGGNVDVLPIDVTSVASIESAVKTLQEKEGRLDILVNNAGIIATFADVLSDSIEDVRKTYETNVFAVMQVTRAFLPLLEKSAVKSITNVTTSLASLSLRNTPSYANYQTPLAAYSSSKAAQNMYTVQLAHALRGKGFRVNAADPGYTKTDINHNSGTLAPEEAAAIVVKGIDTSETGLFFCKDGFQPW